MAKYNMIGHDDLGCMLLIGTIATSCAAGTIWGSPVGWLTLGGICLGVFVIAIVVPPVLRCLENVCCGRTCGPADSETDDKGYGKREA